MKFKTYEKIDLVVLCVLAFGCDMLATYLVNMCANRIRPFPVVGLIITFLAISRWNIKGIIVLPFSVLANFISGKFFIPNAELRTSYDIFTIVISSLAIVPVLISKIFYHLEGQDNILKDTGKFIKMILFIILVSLVVCTIFSYFYSIGNNYDGNIAQKIFGPILGMLLYNAFGYLIFFIGGLILKNQEVLYNVKEKMLKNKNESEAENRYYNNYKENKTK